MPAPQESRRRAVITGAGVVAPGGIGVKAYWDLLADGRSVTRPITAFDASRHRSRVAGECDFDPIREGLSIADIRRYDRATQFAVVAAREAIGDSGLELERLDPLRVGVTLGCAVGNPTAAEPEFAAGEAVRRDGIERRRGLADHCPPGPMAELVRLVGAGGPTKVVSTGCTSGLDSVGHAAGLIARGAADVVVTGGTEAPLTPITVMCFDIIRATSTRNDDPEHACRPFDRTRDGLVLGEGAAVFVVEELEHARRRGAHIYAEVSGFAWRCYPYHMTGVDPEGKELADAIDAAMRQAWVDPAGLDYVNAHGCGTKDGDLHETLAFKRSLGRLAYSIPVSGFKSMIGHSLGAIGSLEIAGCLLAFEADLIPPTANLFEPDPRCDLDYVPLVARERRVDTALTVGSGFGGLQSAMVLQRVDRIIR